MSLSTLANVKEYLGIASGDTDDDTLLTNLLNASISLVNDQTDQVFEAVESTKYFGRDCIEGRKLFTGEFFQSVTTLTNADSTVIASGSYILLPKNNSAYTTIHLKSDVSGWSFPNGDEDFIEVLAYWGLYSTVPAIITQCVNRLTAYLYRQKDNHNDLDRAITTGSTIILPSQLPTDVMSVLKNYRSIL